MTLGWMSSNLKMISLKKNNLTQVNENNTNNNISPAQEEINEPDIQEQQINNFLDSLDEKDTLKKYKFNAPQTSVTDHDW